MRLSLHPSLVVALCLAGVLACSDSPTASSPPAAPTVTLTPSSVGLVPRGSVAVTVSIVRAGNDTSTAALTIEGLPSGVTATFSPATLNASMAGAQLVLTAAANAAPGPFTATVRAKGSSDGSASVTVTVVSADTPTLTSCSTLLWVAYQEGDGPWTRVPSDGSGAYRLPISTRGGVAIVSQGSSGYQTTVLYATSAQMRTAFAQCASSASGTTTGTVTGLEGNQRATIALGTATRTVSAPSPTYSITAAGRPLTLAAGRYVLGATTVGADRVIVRRGVTATQGVALPAIDFSAAEAIATSTAQLSIVGANGSPVFTYARFFSPDGEVDATVGAAVTGGQSYAGLPSSALATGELNGVQVISIDGSLLLPGRVALTYFRDVTDRTLTRGPAGATPTITTVVASPELRPRAQIALQPEYATRATVTFTQNGNVGGPGYRSTSVYATSDYYTAAPTEWDLTVPSLAGVSGYNVIWGLQPNVMLAWTSTVVGGAPFLSPLEYTDGYSVRTALRYSNVAGSPPVR